MSEQPLGQILLSYFTDHLQAAKGLRPASVRSYRDVLRLFLCFVASDARRKISRLSTADLSQDRVLRFLRHLEEERGNGVRTRNHRLAILHGFFEYLGARAPDMVHLAHRIAMIPAKRSAAPETRFLERDEVAGLLTSMPHRGRHACRDRALLLFLYNTGARIQEVADLRPGNLDLGDQPRVRLHGKGDKWRVCPLWPETAASLSDLLAERNESGGAVFVSGKGLPLTRFGLYKIVRRHTGRLEAKRHDEPHHISPHVFRHTTAVHLLESGVEMNVIRSWLGHVSLTTTYRYAEINMRAKEAALRLCEPPVSVEFPRKPVWRDDEALLSWLDSL